MSYNWVEASQPKVWSNESKTEWIRVSRTQPCAICKKQDWCTRASDNSVHCCMRVPSPVELSNGGHLHSGTKTPDRLTPKESSKQSQRINAIAVWTRWLTYHTKSSNILDLSIELGVRPEALKRLNCVRANPRRSAFAFPMFNSYGEIVGLRLRHDDGNKTTVKGSKSGLFLPAGIGKDKYLLIAEGESDTAALLSAGMDAIGRPSCLGLISMVKGYLNRLDVIPEIVICADDDLPGLNGARKLATGLLEVTTSVRIIRPPSCKDFREWIYGGATRQSIECLIHAAKFWRGDR